ncbi:hypothetical protein EZV62_004682 [Acer yangbiense]|uniref:Uncharacterized protein n=1 Tax=Acer yangbiense TaxID=1000413 RepID=A0A5C7IK27_9ROSI|nr:hypothetical protein EZV62_004682 [Acer yangbiense]
MSHMHQMRHSPKDVLYVKNLDTIGLPTNLRKKVKVPHQKRKRLLIKCPMHQLVQLKGLNLMNAAQAIVQQHIWVMFAPK